MKICVLGTGRSGTKAIYGLLQKILSKKYPGDIDFVYEPFLWDRATFNLMFEEISNEFSFTNSISQYGIYNHLSIPLFIENPEPYLKNEYVKSFFIPNENKSKLLVKFIRANGRFRLLEKIVPECKFIFIIRNPVDVINSVINKFSFHGDEFYKSDFPRFRNEIERIYNIRLLDKNEYSPVKREVLYWYYMNDFALKSFYQSNNTPLLLSLENFIKHPKESVKSICNFLGIDELENYIDLSKQKVGDITPLINLTEQDWEELQPYLNIYTEMLKNNRIHYPEDILETIKKKYINNFKSKDNFENYRGKTTLFLNGIINNFHKEIVQKKTTVDELKMSIKSLNLEVKSHQKELKDFELQITDNKNIIIEKEKEIKKYQDYIFLKEDEIDRLKNNIKSQKKLLDNFYNSLTYKIVRKFGVYK